MGNLVSSYMTETFKKNQELMEKNSIVMLERNIQLQDQLRKRAVATQIAGGRDFFYWIAGFYGVATVGLIGGYRKSKNKALLVPMIPLTFLLAYNWDLAYGNKIHRIRMEAEHILANEFDLLAMPCDLPTPSSLDEGRRNFENKHKIHPLPIISA